MKKLFVFLILACSGPAISLAGSADLQTIWLNRQGVRLLKEQKPEEALAKFSQALASSPDLAEVHLNMGLAFEAMGQPDKAIQAYQTADRVARSQEQQFVARFNQGALHQKAKKVDEALAAYHQALDVNPSSIETKINIELLIQQQQQGKGGGEGDKDQKDKDQKGQGKDPKDQQGQDKKDPKDGQGEQKDQNKNQQYAKEKPQPRPFKSEELSQGDVNKILGELRNQEQRIRADYNKREVKERPRDKDW